MAPINALRSSLRRTTPSLARAVAPARGLAPQPSLKARLTVARPVSTFASAKQPPVQLDGRGAQTAPVATPAPTTGAPEGTVINQKLYDYLQANPGVRTVQQLINQTYPKGQYNAVCAELGLNPTELAKYRSASLMDFAVLPPRGDGTAPRTVDEANRHFITQYQNDTYNRESPNSWSNNCGPTSLAMVMRVNGKMPQGLNPEQQIDHARALMYPDLAKSSGSDVTLPDGSTVRVLNADKMLTGMGAMTTGAQGGGFEGAVHEKGWAAFDAALNAGESLVVEGNISSAWRANFADEAKATGGSYQSGGNGHFLAVLGKTGDEKYLVADPMFSGGTVEMTRDELAVFFKQQNGEPSFMNP